MIAERLRILVKSYPILYRAAKQCQDILGRSSDDFSTSQICGPDKDICVEGYPSSANSFLLNVLRQIRPDLTIASHTHSVANIKLAEKHGVPWVLLMRKPVQAVASRVARFDTDPVRGFEEWSAMYGSATVRKHRERVILFSQLTTETEDAIHTIETITGIELSGRWSSEIESIVLEHIRDWARERGRGGSEGAPSAEKDTERDYIARQLTKLPEAREANDIFDRLVDATV